MPKRPLGYKIEKNQEISNQIILWLKQEPGLKSYTIQKRLEDFNFKVSVPTLDSWMVNYLTDKTKEFEEKKNLILEDDKLDIEVRYNNLKDLINQLDEVTERKNEVKLAIANKKLKTKDSEVVIYIDTFYEKCFQEYCKMILDIRKEIFKCTSASNPYAVVKDAIKKLIDHITVLLVKYKVNEEDITKLKQFIADLDSEFFTKYSMEKKK